MTNHVEATGAGLVLRDAAGQQVASLTLIECDGYAMLAFAGDWPSEVGLTREALAQIEETFGRAYRAILLGGPRVPRREPELPATVSPMG